MLRHIVLLRLKSEATPEEIDAWRAAAITMCKNSPEVLSFTFGENVGSGPNHYDTALVADFEDIDAFRRYISGPEHQAYVANHASVVVDQLAAIQHPI